MELSADWVVGFVDGEGCFHVSINRHDGMTAGYQVLPEFVVVQHERDVQVLHGIKKFFGGGIVRQNHGDRQCLRVRKLETLEKVCEFFMAHPLKTRKQQDFLKFRKVISLMRADKHLDKIGVGEIVEVALSMNTAQRPSLEKILKELVG